MSRDPLRLGDYHYGLSGDFTAFNKVRIRSKTQSGYCSFAWYAVVIRSLNGQLNFAPNA